MDLIKAANTAYFPTGPNSNSVIDTAISYAGLPEPTRDSGDPNRPGRSHADYASPGSGTMLPLEPSPPPPEPPPSGYYSPSWLFPPEGPLAGSEAAISPLVLDLDGDGIELTELGATATWFDLDADGFGERTGWVAPDDALLALDRDGNGTIDDISELFGNATTNGFIELADLDSDASGAIDLFDAQWHNLRLWIDADSDGISDDGELHTLDAFGIVSLSLAYQPDGSTLAGHLVSDVSTFSYADGSTGALVDVWFENSQVDTRFIGDWTPDPDALLLGSIRGYGTVPGLTVAMSGDPGLKDLVAAYQWRDWSTPDGALAEAEALVLRWTGADGVDPTSRGTHVDARKLATLEAFAGRGFVQENGGNTDPRWDAGAMLEASFDHVAAQVAARLALQGSLATLLVGVSYSVGADMVVGALDYDQSFAAMETIAPSLGAPLADRVGFLVADAGDSESRRRRRWRRRHRLRSGGRTLWRPNGACRWTRPTSAHGRSSRRPTPRW